MGLPISNLIFRSEVADLFRRDGRIFEFVPALTNDQISCQNSVYSQFLLA